jgi:hypothetical protein
MVDTTGQADLRAENVSAIVTGFALQEYKMKPLLMESSSSSWIESYYKETKAELTGGTGSAVKGVPRLANFPYGEVSWTKASSYLEKYGMEGVISWEDSKTNNIDVIARTLLRIGRAVAFAVDTQIEAAIRGATGINTFALTALYEWNAVAVAQRDPIGDILKAKRYVAQDNYDIDGGNGFIAMNPLEYEYLLNNQKVINNPTFKSADVVTNGVVGRICGLKIIVSNAVTTDNVIVGISKEMGSWKSAAGLTVKTIDNPGIDYKIRAWEVGVCQITNPEAICVITNTMV